MEASASTFVVGGCRDGREGQAHASHLECAAQVVLPSIPGCGVGTPNIGEL